MPTVPTVSGPKQALAGMPDARFAAPRANAPDVQLRPSLLATPQVNGQHIDTPQFKTPLADPGAIQPIRLGDGGAAGYEQAGHAIGRVSDAISQQVLAYQRQVNATIADDALDQARQAAMRLTYGAPDGNGGLVGGYRNVKGENAFRSADGKSPVDALGAAFDERVQAITSAKLTNADQQNAFHAQIGSIRDGLIQGASSHAAEQFAAYQDQVYKSTGDNLVASFGLLDPTDREGQQKILGQVKDVIGTRAALQGAPAAVIDDAYRERATQAVAGLFDRTMAAGQYLQATALTNEYAGQIDSNVAARMRTALKEHVTQASSVQLESDIWGRRAAPAFSAGDSDRAFNVNIGLESHGKQTGADGKLLASPNGTSFGAGQLNPDTAEATAKAHHAPPGYAKLAMQATPAGRDANLQISKWHWGDLVGQFGGDVVKASAAYNAGAGYLVGGKSRNGAKLEGALKWAARTGQDWTACPELPKETRERIANVQAAMKQGEGAPPLPKLSDLYDEVDRRTQDPEIAEKAKAGLARRMVAAEKDRTTGFEEAKASAIRTLDEARGDINAVPPGLWSKVKPEDRDTLRNYAKGVAEDKARPTDPAALYQLQDDKFLKGLTREQLWGFRPQLSPDHFNTMADRWTQLQKPVAATDPNDLDRPTVNQLVESRMRFYGMDPNSKKPDDVAQVAAVRQLALDYVLAQQQSSGKKFGYKEMNDHINFLFSAQDHFRTVLFGHPIGDRQSQRILGESIGDIPADSLASVKKQLKDAGISNPSEAQVVDAYRRTRFFGSPAGGARR